MLRLSERSFERTRLPSGGQKKPLPQKWRNKYGCVHLYLANPEVRSGPVSSSTWERRPRCSSVTLRIWKMFSPQARCAGRARFCQLPRWETDVNHFAWIITRYNTDTHVSVYIFNMRHPMPVAWNWSGQLRVQNVYNQWHVQTIRTITGPWHKPFGLSITDGRKLFQAVMPQCLLHTQLSLRWLTRASVWIKWVVIGFYSPETGWAKDLQRQV